MGNPIITSIAIFLCMILYVAKKKEKKSNYERPPKKFQDRNEFFA